MQQRRREFDLAAYLRRVGLDAAASGDYPADSVKTLSIVMGAQAHAVPFENLDVVVGHTISMKPGDIEDKLVHRRRGGYCFEVNTLLRLALDALGFTNVEPMLCRVRYNKPEHTMLAPSHMVLKVSCDDGNQYLADVGFAGNGVPEPIDLAAREAVLHKHGCFRVRPYARAGCTAVLQKRRRDSNDVPTGDASLDSDWIDCYIFNPDIYCEPADLELCNWGSCTMPGARFTSQLFAHCVKPDSTHYVSAGSVIVAAPDVASTLLTVLLVVLLFVLPHPSKGSKRRPRHSPPGGRWLARGGEAHN